MFNSDKKKTQNTQEPSTMEMNRISKNTIFKGIIESQGNFRIDGEVDGELTTTGKVIIGPEGKITGKVKCVNADIEGVFEGHLEVQSSLCLKPTANVSGDVYIESLTVEPGAIFNANCRRMSSAKETNVKTLDGSKGKQKVKNVS